ncbi:hypothetical protein [Herbaspirillum sp.]|uniref:hypothetical protein n=1 Tax=Herbaspirillum sp. TaxID=1890675 RepID=UPI001B2219AA|nr:hypothetical protein [Herbaspirillum sp.]MBO9536362.1 hypothetical protein [Herbaspirillum sp.]
MKKNILQIHYDDASRKMLDPGFTPLEIVGNPRPDWREYWGIRNYFLNNVLNEDEYYGFLSPAFRNKTHLSAEQVEVFMENNPGHDVYTFSPMIQEAACYLNVFEQGNRHHPGLIGVAEAFSSSIGLSVNLKTLVNDFRTTVFCNYIIAKPVFWEKWFTINERLFEIAENKQGRLGEQLTAVTDYSKAQVQMKVFMMERTASLILALSPELSIAAYDINAMPMSHPQFARYRKEMTILNALKIAYTSTSDSIYQHYFFTLRQEVLAACEPDYPHATRIDYLS